MKTLKNILTALSVILSLSVNLLAEDKLLDPVPDDIDAILPPYISDLGQSSKMSEEEETAWKTKVDAIPDVTNRLCELFWPLWDLEEDQLTPMIGKTLATRHDMSPAQQERLAGLIKKLDAGKMTKDQLDHWGSLLFGLKILENYPSPEHEEIVLEILNSGNHDYRNFALETIRKIGSEKSIDYVRKLMEEETHKAAGQVRNPSQRTWYDSLEGLEKQLVQRVEKKRRDKERDAGAVDNHQSKQQDAVHDGDSPTDGNTRWFWGIGIAVTFLVVAASFALLRGGRSKK